MRGMAVLLAMVAAVSGSIEAQITTTTGGSASVPHQARAAGMPLRDGALAPGMMTVRVVHGGFSNNLPNQSVTVEVLGGKTEMLNTGADGRASFAHLPVGAKVRAWAVVSGERLESDVFDMPVESGVRVLLIAGGGQGEAAVASQPAVPAAADPQPQSGPVVEVIPGDAGGTPTGANSMVIIRLSWIVLTVAAVGYVTRPWWMSR